MVGGGVIDNAAKKKCSIASYHISNNPGLPPALQLATRFQISSTAGATWKRREIALPTARRAPARHLKPTLRAATR